MSLNTLLAFGIGVGVALVVLLGLSLAMKEFIYLAQHPELPTKKKIQRGVIGFIYFIGQILVAVAVFFKVPLVQDHMLPVGFGLVLAMLGASFFLKSFAK